MPSTNSARNGRLKQKAAATVGIKWKNFIKIRPHTNNKPRRVKRRAQKPDRFNKYKTAANMADIPNPATTDHFQKYICLRRAARPPWPGNR
jgi:hypothetical protein